MSEIEKLFDELPGAKWEGGSEYNPSIQKDCDGYYSACYQASNGNVMFSDGTGYGTPELALEALVERANKVELS